VNSKPVSSLIGSAAGYLTSFQPIQLKPLYFATDGFLFKFKLNSINENCDAAMLKTAMLQKFKLNYFNILLNKSLLFLSFAMVNPIPRYTVVMNDNFLISFMHLLQK
jgi:hypothetical protein